MRELRLLIMCALTALAVCACSGSSGPPAGRTPAPRSGCVAQQQATAIWTRIDNGLNAIELDPQHAGVGQLATGNALSLITMYLQQQLVALHLTEREVDRLDHVTVVEAGCNGGTLVLRITMTLVRDDYLAADGHVDHQDAQVGRTLHILQSYTKSAGTWKESDFQDLDQPQPSQTPQLLRDPHGSAPAIY